MVVKGKVKVLFYRVEVVIREELELYLGLDRDLGQGHRDHVGLVDDEGLAREF